MPTPLETEEKNRLLEAIMGKETTDPNSVALQQQAVKVLSSRTTAQTRWITPTCSSSSMTPRVK